jgi:hypothetical protein
LYRYEIQAAICFATQAPFIPRLKPGKLGMGFLAQFL